MEGMSDINYSFSLNGLTIIKHNIHGYSGSTQNELYCYIIIAKIFNYSGVILLLSLYHEGLLQLSR